MRSALHVFDHESRVLGAGAQPEREFSHNGFAKTVRAKRLPICFI